MQKKYSVIVAITLGLFSFSAFSGESKRADFDMAKDIQEAKVQLQGNTKFKNSAKPALNKKSREQHPVSQPFRSMH